MSIICQIDGNDTIESDSHVDIPAEVQSQDLLPMVDDRTQQYQLGTQPEVQSQDILQVVVNRTQTDYLPGEKRSIQDRIAPDIPEPSLVDEADAYGWCLIDQVGAWPTMLCEFKVMEDIPCQHKSIWTWAWSYVLERILNAINPCDLNRALMWLLFLPQALLRQPKRGGKSGRNLTAQRFNLLVNGDWGQLVTLWEKDKIVAQEKKRFLREKTVLKDNNLDLKTRNAVNLISQGQVSKAAKRINSHGVADTDDQRVMQQIRMKYPERGRPLPDNVGWGRPVENLRGLRESLLSLERGKSPGSGGLRAEFLVILAEMMTEQQMNMFEEFGMKYLCGDLPAWFNEVWLSVLTASIQK